MTRKLSDLTLEELWVLFPVVINDHNPSYAQWYKDERDALKKVLSSKMIGRVSHIGSTAVANLKSKPTVDILLELSEGSIIDEVEKLLCQDSWINMSKQKNPYVSYSYNKGYTPNGYDERVFHLHVRYENDWDELYFCEYLKNHEHIAKDYAVLKSELALEFKNNRDAYTDAKSEFIKKHTNIARCLYKGKF